MTVEKKQEIQVQLLQIAKEYAPFSFEDMLKKFRELCKELKV